LDIIATVLCDPDDAIVVPAPYYGAFATDLAGRSGAKLIAAPLSSSDGFRLNAESIDQTVTEARRAGITVRAVALTSPYNPVGHVYDAATLRAIATVAARHDIDLIADEIYAHSTFGLDPFVSVLASAVGGIDPGRVHLIWGFAKDFGLPGLKVGVLHTRDPDVGAAARALAYFAPTSTDTQSLLITMLADHDWLRFFTAENRSRLAASYANAAGWLDDHGIGYLPAAAGFSIWVDLRQWLAEPTFASELDLWRQIFQATRVNILPGEIFASGEPGWFRLCHTTEASTVREGIARLARFFGGGLR
jgi:aspartate/methionine/tyrosine aminotransferase